MLLDAVLKRHGLPKGLLLIGWDVNKGPFLIHKVPADLEVSGGLLTQIYSAHRYYSLEPGFSSLTFQGNKVVSFFSGLKGDIVGEANMVLAMVLLKDETVSKFKALLLDQGRTVLEAFSVGNYKQLMEKLFEKMKKA